ncbi:hypothetical protein PR048_025740 [Dryococelus australis]|uniref:Serpin domain-containing protein n=1 Tax=Dryococelus australis TaxID=614101 RepID=A0ABQ9GJF5_9NEOP|nr:hypothetical protein PR048_025740 [Dryococelus australis]
MMSTSNYTLDLADAMFVSKTCPVKKSFQDIAHTSFMTDVEAVDFSNTSSAADVINLWVRNSTADKITNLFNSGEVSSQTKLLLASTLYFHGSWENGFNSSKTKKLPFHVDSQTTVQTDMMTTMAEFRYAYYKDLDAEVVALDYKGGEVRMVIVLPGEVDGLEKLLSSISSLDQIKPGESPVRVEVTLPKFKAEQELDFIPILQKLGIRDVFTSAADLSGISEADQLTVSQVKQKAVLEVSEEGPVAAAITGTPGGGSQPIIHAFDADHGFVYFLQHFEIQSVLSSRRLNVCKSVPLSKVIKVEVFCAGGDEEQWSAKVEIRQHPERNRPPSGNACLVLFSRGSGFDSTPGIDSNLPGWDARWVISECFLVSRHCIPIAAPSASHPIDASAAKCRCGAQGAVLVSALVCLAAAATIHQELDESSSHALKAVSGGNKKFAWDLLKAIDSKKSQNAVVSPLSLHVALAFLSQGAKSSTKEQIIKAAYLPTDDDVTQDGFRAMLTPLRMGEGVSSYVQDTANYTLALADAAFIERTFPMKKSFRQVARANFMADSKNVDFASNTNGAIDVINQWVRNNTAGKIKKLISQGEVNSQTKFVLANALYFNGSWENGFDSSKTRKRPFHVDSQTTVQTDMMTTTNRFNYSYSNELKAQVLALNYKDCDVRMVIALPDNVGGLEALESRINSLEKIKLRLYPQQVNVTLPKFKIAQEIEYSPILKKLGITEVFSQAANLRGISDAKNLQVSHVKQKVVIEDSEEPRVVVKGVPMLDSHLGEPGSIPAGRSRTFPAGIVPGDAAGRRISSGISVSYGLHSDAAPYSPRFTLIGSQDLCAGAATTAQIHDFIADRGFLFLLEHTTTNTVIMYGRFSKP